jgi:hypothetical protein
VRIRRSIHSSGRKVAPIAADVCTLLLGVDDGHFVQVSYPAEPGWVTVAVYGTCAAARADANVYRDRCNARGATPKRVRLVSAAECASAPRWAR